MLFAGFLVARGVPTLRHDWNWPIDRGAVPPFVQASIYGWLSAGFGMSNPHPTTYLIALPIGFAMWLVGPLATLALLGAATGYLCMRCVAAASSHWESSWPAAVGIGLFTLFNPWVYNEVVAGHLVMVLAYAGFIGLLVEMLRGHNASWLRLAAWIALIEAQLQFFVLAMLALGFFAFATRKWLPLAFGVIFSLPSAIGLFAERGALLRIPYSVTWQTNQSVAPLALLGLGGYFPGYADRLGIAAAVAVWLVLGLAIVGAIAARRSKAAILAIVAAAFIYIAIAGLHGPIAAPYAWLVRNLPESGIFRELYDLAGVFAALLVLLACAGTARFRKLGYVALAAGILLPITWLLRPPSDLWIASNAYPHPVIVAPAFTRVALLPAFQPLGLTAGGGDGADPDAYVYRAGVSVLNEYFPTYPVDMALARYELSGDAEALRALGVSEVIARPWLVSRTRGGIGLAASSLQPRPPRRAVPPLRYVDGTMPLISQCAGPRIVALPNSLGPCDVFFGDAAQYAPLRPLIVPSDSIDPQTAWIDARLAFAESPGLAQAIGGALTQSRLPLGVEPGAWLLAYVRGTLRGSDGRALAHSSGAFVWLRIPAAVAAVECTGTCELVAQTARLPNLASYSAAARAPASALDFREFTPWLYVVDRAADSGPANQLLRFNERYDDAWIAVASGRALRHIRIDMSANGWVLGASSRRIVLIQVTALLQMTAEIIGLLCVLWLVKALAPVPTKRAP